MYGGGVMPGRRAGSLHCVGKYNAESPKQDSKRFNSITKTIIHFAHLGILLIYEPELAAQLLLLVTDELLQQRASL